MAITGRTGADAIFTALKHICGTLVRYSLKLNSVINEAHAADVITDQQRDDAVALVNLASAACTAFAIIADYSGFRD